MDRLSCHGFRANALRLLEHVLAYAIVVLYREATAAVVAEMAKAQVSTWRTRWWKVGALVKTSVRRVWFRFSATWPHQQLLVRVHEAAMQFVRGLHNQPNVGPNVPPLLLK